MRSSITSRGISDSLLLDESLFLHLFGSLPSHDEVNRLGPAIGGRWKPVLSIIYHANDLDLVVVGIAFPHGGIIDQATSAAQSVHNEGIQAHEEDDNCSSENGLDFRQTLRTVVSVIVCLIAIEYHNEIVASAVTTGLYQPNTASQHRHDQEVHDPRLYVGAKPREN